MRVLLALVILCLLLVRTARADEDDEIVLKGGLVLHGHTLGEETLRGRRVVRFETDFGVLRIDKSRVRRAPPTEPTDGVFFFHRIRVARVEGRVEKRSPGSTEWVPVRLREEYGPVLNAPDAIVRPGDAIRTGPNAFVDLMPHRGVWVRVTADAEIDLPAERGDTSLVVLRGRALQRIDDKPRGKTFVVRTTSRRITVRGTEFLVEVGVQERVAVTRGEIEVEGGTRVGEGTAGRWQGEGAVDVGAISASDRDALTVEAVRLPEEDAVYVPSGDYVMGGRGDADAPKRTVALTGYLIDRRETTNEEYARFARATGHEAPRYFVGGKPPKGEERHPVRALTADMARSYAAWSGRRLPTEAQWEAAARGPSALAYPWGKRPLGSKVELPYVKPENFRQAEVKGLRPVDEETPDVSPFGLVSMSSSVPEWCRDWYDETFYTRGKDQDPQGPPGGIWRVVRGHWIPGVRGATPSVTARRRTAEEDAESSTGVRGVVEPE